MFLIILDNITKNLIEFSRLIQEFVALELSSTIGNTIVDKDKRNDNSCFSMKGSN